MSALQALGRVGMVFGGFGGGIFFRAELFLYVWARFPSEGTADFRSKMGLGQVL